MGTPVHLDWIFRESEFLYLYEILNRHHLNIDFTQLRTDDPKYKEIIEFHRLLNRFMETIDVLKLNDHHLKVMFEITNNKTICD